MKSKLRYQVSVILQPFGLKKLTTESMHNCNHSRVPQLCVYCHVSCHDRHRKKMVKRPGGCKHSAHIHTCHVMTLQFRGLCPSWPLHPCKQLCLSHRHVFFRIHGKLWSCGIDEARQMNQYISGHPPHIKTRLAPRYIEMMHAVIARMVLKIKYTVVIAVRYKHLQWRQKHGVAFIFVWNQLIVN